MNEARITQADFLAGVENPMDSPAVNLAAGPDPYTPEAYHAELAAARTLEDFVRLVARLRRCGIAPNEDGLYDFAVAREQPDFDPPLYGGFRFVYEDEKTEER